MPGERGGHQEAEALFSDLPLADAGVPVDARAKLFHRIVDVEGVEVLEADDPVEFLERLFPLFRGSDIVACGEDVAGVDADADRNFMMEAAEDEGEVLKTVADAASLARGRLKEDAGFPLMDRAFHAYKTFDDCFEALLFRSACCGSRMEVEIGDFEEVASFQFALEGLAAFSEHFGVGGAEIDQVAVVAHYLLDACFSECFFPEIYFLGRDLPAGPLFLVAGKKLNCRSANLFSFEKGVGGAAGSGGMGSNPKFLF